MVRSWLRRHWCLGIAAVLLLISMIQSCATVVSGSTQDIRVNSDPDGARVKIYDRYESEVWSGETPATAVLARGAGFFEGATYRVVISLDGYEPVTVYLSSNINAGWYLAGNFLLGGLIGWLIVDPATGAMWTLAPEFINRSLERDGTAGTGSASIMVALIEDVPDQVTRWLVPVSYGLP